MAAATGTPEGGDDQARRFRNTMDLVITGRDTAETDLLLRSVLGVTRCWRRRRTE